MKKIVIFVFALVLLPIVSHADIGPDQLIKEQTSQILALIKKNRKIYEKDRSKLFAMAHQLIVPHIDFVVMSKWILGRSVWGKATEQQRQDFIREFKNLMVRTYSIALLKYTSQKMIYFPLKFKEGDRIVTVKTEIKQSGAGENVPIIYSFYNNKDRGWKIIDVKIAGISMVTTYRSEYNSRIQREGLDSLIKKMANGNDAAISTKKIEAKVKKNIKK